MHIILLSGGSGTRLWPLSNDARSKQFLRLLPGVDSLQPESMIQRVVRQLKESGLDTPGHTVAFDPIQTLFPILIGPGCRSFRRSGARS